jgi:hypothetical protein
LSKPTAYFLPYKDKKTMMSTSERLKILDMIENGTITAEEGMRLLAALEHENMHEFFDDMPSSDEHQAFFNNGMPDADSLVDNIEPEEIHRWKRWWSLPLWIGLGIVVLSSFWMQSAWSTNALGFWFFCTWVPMLLGILMMALAWNSRTAPWLHLRVRQAPGEKPDRIAISLPIPLRISAWGLRRFGHHIPNFDATGLDEVLIALNDTKNDNAPLFIDVHDDEDGEHVLVFIG